MDVFADPSIEHGTPEGYAAGCRGAGCPAGREYGFSCSRAMIASRGDARYKALRAKGYTPEQMAEALALPKSSDAPAGKGRATVTTKRHRGTPPPGPARRLETAPAPAAETERAPEVEVEAPRESADAATTPRPRLYDGGPVVVERPRDVHPEWWQVQRDAEVVKLTGERDEARAALLVALEAIGRRDAEIDRLTHEIDELRQEARDRAQGIDWAAEAARRFDATPAPVEGGTGMPEHAMVDQVQRLARALVDTAPTPKRRRRLFGWSTR